MPAQHLYCTVHALKDRAKMRTMCPGAPSKRVELARNIGHPVQRPTKKQKNYCDFKQQYDYQQAKPASNMVRFISAYDVHFQIHFIKHSLALKQ